MTFAVDLNNTQGKHIAFCSNFLGVLDPSFTELRNMDQTFKVIISQSSKGTKLCQMSDGAFHKLALSQIVHLLDPGIFLQAANREANPFLIAVNTDHLHLDFLSNFEHFVGMLNAFPRYF